MRCVPESIKFRPPKKSRCILWIQKSDFHAISVADWKREPGFSLFLSWKEFQTLIAVESLLIWMKQKSLTQKSVQKVNKKRLESMKKDASTAVRKKTSFIKNPYLDGERKRYHAHKLFDKKNPRNKKEVTSFNITRTRCVLLSKSVWAINVIMGRIAEWTRGKKGTLKIKKSFIHNSQACEKFKIS